MIRPCRRRATLTRSAGPRMTAAVLLACLAGAACEDRIHREIAAEIHLLLEPKTAILTGTQSRLTAFGIKAIPQIEVALHTASVRGRQDLIAALVEIGDAEAIPILRHFAVYDENAAVRDACRQALSDWKAGSGQRAEAASKALDRIATLDARGIGPSPQAGPPPR